MTKSSWLVHPGGYVRTSYSSTRFLPGRPGTPTRRHHLPGRNPITPLQRYHRQLLWAVLSTRAHYHDGGHMNPPHYRRGCGWTATPPPGEAVLIAPLPPTATPRTRPEETG